MEGGWQGRRRGRDLVAAVVTEAWLVGEAEALEGCPSEGVVPEPGLVVAAEPTGLRDGRLVRAPCGDELFVVQATKLVHDRHGVTARK